jgi:tRNA-specific 2-thiouridylase
VAVATGHYARITRDPTTGRFLLWRGRDARKDQSDFLWPLSQDQLGAARFPVGDLAKDEVRARARALDLATADTPESQEICFIPDHDYRGFLRRRVPEAFREGAIVDGQGRTLGRHGGLADFTVGQRRGLGLATGRTLYVTALDPRRNAVVVGPASELEADRLWADQLNLISQSHLVAPLVVEAKIRHNQTPVAATLFPPALADDGRSLAEVRFHAPQRAVTPGQSVVFYRGELVVGGGVIARPEGGIGP